MGFGLFPIVWDYALSVNMAEQVSSLVTCLMY